MRSSVDLLSGIADSLTDALNVLDRESHAVAEVLEQTASEIGANLEIGTILRRAASDLEAFGAPAEDRLAAGASEKIFSAIARTYTMARERDIHARILGGGVPAEAPAPAAADVDDIFF
jgi:hypothetical protein